MAVCYVNYTADESSTVFVADQSWAGIASEGIVKKRMQSANVYMIVYFGWQPRFVFLLISQCVHRKCNEKQWTRMDETFLVENQITKSKRDATNLRDGENIALNNIIIITIFIVVIRSVCAQCTVHFRYFTQSCFVENRVWACEQIQIEYDHMHVPFS